MGNNLYQISGHDSPIICAKSIFRGSEKLHRFEAVAVQLGFGGIKRLKITKIQKILRFLNPCEI